MTWLYHCIYIPELHCELQYSVVFLVIFFKCVGLVSGTYCGVVDYAGSVIMIATPKLPDTSVDC